MRLVIVESPFKAKTWFGRWQNVKYARRCLRHSLAQGEAPIASHLLYTQKGVLNDSDAHERSQGIMAGLAWGSVADATVVYQDRGISSGMQMGIDAAKIGKRVVEYRMIEKTAPDWGRSLITWLRGILPVALRSGK